MKYVLDTNIVALWLRNDDRVLARLKTIKPADLGLPLMVLAELLFGAEKSARPKGNRDRVDRLAARIAVLPMTRVTIEHYAAERAQLEKRGLPKSDFDLIIACTALEHGAILVTNDGNLNDGSIKRLRVEDWLAP
ncbi:MAG TPA: type II toxin-antitoxin system VapC family toxin [Polyangiaceae bacterium]|nr:type II toxin-antitoxin system VapC family toxin [Polyangiaceae bacterium]